MTDTEQPRLARRLGVVGLTLFGVNYMAVVGVFTTYGIVNAVTGGHLAAAYVLALVVTLFTACSYSIMSRRFPVAGSAYTYSQQSFGGVVGFLTGWVMLLDYLFIPMIDFMLIGIYMHREFPGVPMWAFTLVPIAVAFLFNVIGITAMNRANALIVGLSVLLVVLVVAFALEHVAQHGAATDLLAPFRVGSGGIGAVASGAAILAMGFLGFDAVATLSEEAVRPRRDIPIAIPLAALVGGACFIVVAWAGGVAFAPVWSTLSESQVSSAGVTLVNNIGDHAFSLFFVGVYVIGAFGSGMTAQVSVTRILYAMSRDGVLPKPLGLLHSRFRTPWVAACVVSAIALLSLALSLEAAAFMISFGALCAFAVVNLCVVRQFLAKRMASGLPTIMRWAVYAVTPVVGFLLTLWLLSSLHILTWLVGAGWLVVGIAVLALRTNGFRNPVPQMHFTER